MSLLCNNVSDGKLTCTIISTQCHKMELICGANCNCNVQLVKFDCVGASWVQ